MNSETGAEPIIESAAKGATIGALEFGEDKIKAMAKAILQGELGFIEDEETIEVVRSQRKKPEWGIYRKYVNDNDLRLQIEMGFSLRQLEGKPQKLKDLRDKIYSRYGSNGLNVAELVQSGVFRRYVWLLLGNTNTNEKELEDGIKEILTHIDRYTEFVKKDTDTKKTAQILSGRINTLLPRVFIVFSRYEQQIKKANEIIEEITKSVSGYRFERQIDYEVNCQFDFIIKSEGEVILADYLEDSS
jgi:hypothetical protein